MGHSSLNPGKLGTPGRGLTAKAPRERVGKQYKGTQRTRKAVHGECAVELAKWTFPIISLCREPYEAKVSRTGLTGGMGRRTVRQRALCLPSEAALKGEKKRNRMHRDRGRVGGPGVAHRNVRRHAVLLCAIITGREQLNPTQLRRGI